MKHKPNLANIEGVKRMTYLFKFFILSLMPLTLNGLIISQLYAQEIDNNRMSQDIEVAERILEELFGGNRGGHDFGNQRKSHGIYLRDYGVILQVPAVNLNNFAYAVGQGNTFSISGDAIILDDIIRLRTERGTDQNKSKSNNRIRPIKSLDSLVIMRRQKILDKMQSFYTNYGDLIGQLKDNDKIMLVYDSHGRDFGNYTFSWRQRTPRHQDHEVDEEDDAKNEDDEPREKLNQVYAPVLAGVNTDNRRTQKIVMEVSRGDINQYKTGKLSKEQFINKIKIQEEIKDSESELEFDILAGIFEKIAKRESNDFYFNQKVRYQRLANFGVMYDLELHPQYTWMINKNDWTPERIIELQNGVYIHGKAYKNKDKNKDKLDKETKRQQAEVEREKAEIEKENQEKQAEMEKFEKEIKENLIQYGRTLRSLKPDEFLALNVKFKSWGEDESIPKNVMFTVKKTVLEAYDKREISLEDAMSKIEVKK